MSVPSAISCSLIVIAGEAKQPGADAHPNPPELKEYEHKILTAQERSGEIERRLFGELRRQLLDSRLRPDARDRSPNR